MSNRDGRSRLHLSGTNFIQALILAIVLAPGIGSVHAAEPTRRFDIPAQSLPSALLEFGRQAETQVLLGYDDSETDVDAIITKSVVGSFTVRDALTRMLYGTGVRFRFTGPNKIAVSLPAAGPTPPSGGAVKLVSDTEMLDEVLVTGSRIHGAADAISPTVIVTKQELRRAPFATVQDALYSLPLSSLSGPREDLGVSGNAGFGAGINLRALGPGATLVLVNGQRQPASGQNGSFTDVSNIPSIAVERIEIVPDGSSALYGSDAIAGVVNIIMRDDLDGAETQARFTGVGGGANELQVSQQFGKRWDSGNAYFAYQYSQRASLAASDRFYAANADKRPLGGTDHRTYFASPGNILDPQTLQPILGIPASGVTAAGDYSRDINLASRFAEADLLPERDTHSVFLTASQALGQWLIKASGRFGLRSATKQAVFPQTILVLPQTNPFFVDPFPEHPSPSILVAQNFEREFEDPVAFDSTTRVATGELTAATALSDTWLLTLTQTYGKEQLRTVTENLLNPALLSTALNQTDPAKAFNPFGPTNPEVISGLRRSLVESTLSGIAATSIVADGSIGQLPSGPVKLAIGGEYRHESFDYVSTPVAKTQSQRQVSSAFIELAVPVIGQRGDVKAAPRLEFSAAGRFENYSDFGDTFNPQLGVHWIPIDALKLRASWGRSFRAPVLIDRDTTSNVSGIVSLADPKSPSGISTVVAIQGNNPEIRQETARTSTIGLDFVPASIPGLNFSLTYFDVLYADQIVLPGDTVNPFDILLNEDKWSSIINRHPGQEQIDAICRRADFVGPVSCEVAQPTIIVDIRRMNLAETTTRGFEAELRRTWANDLGSFGVRLMSSYLLEFKLRGSPTAPAVDVMDSVSNPPSLRVRADGEWSQHREGMPGLSAAASVSFTKGYRDTGSVSPRRVRASTTMDLQLGYRTSATRGWLANTDVMLNAVNVLDAAPPFVDREEGFDILNAQPIGRTISLEVRKSW